MVKLVRRRGMIRRIKRRRGKSTIGKVVGTAARIASTAYTAYRIAKGVASIVNSEKKYYDVNQSVTANTTGSIATCSNIQSGVGANQRVGISVKLDSVLLRFLIKNAGTNPSTAVRIIVFMDTEQAGIPPVPGDILQVVGFLSPLKIQNSKRFVVLRDTTIDVNADYPYKHLSVYRNYHKTTIHMKWQGTTGLLSDMRNNHIYILFISNQDATDAPTVDFYSRIRYYDN